MKMSTRVCRIQLLASCLLMLLFYCADAYDTMDPKGNMTIKWDFQTIRPDGYTVMVNIYNNQLYRHVERPGWRLSWTWANQEVIWGIWGGETTEQGDCSKFRADNTPHCCDVNPVVADLLPGAPFNQQVHNCCRGGVLSSLIQDPTAYMSSFQMSVGIGLNVSDPATKMPSNFSIGLPGYTCSNASKIASSKFPVDSQRHTQALMTWVVTCSYSQFRESASPSCCVSLSTFYNNTMVSCPLCSCGCQDSSSTSKCYRVGEQPDSLQLPNDNNTTTPHAVLCTEHMCPIRVHWHLKVNYKEYWRVKVTITNFNLINNYSDWNLLMQHPNLRSITEVFSFNYKPLIQYGNINDTGMFWGLQPYNDILLQYGEKGDVQTEILLQKDPGEFTFKGGWAFPRRITFNGHDCVMPHPDMYPSLPNGSPPSSALCYHLTLVVSLMFLFLVLIVL